MQNNKNKGNTSFYINILIGAAIGIGITFLMLLIIAAIMVLLNIGSNYSSVLSSIAVALGGFIGSYFAARKNGSKGLINGAAVAVVMYIIISVVALFVNQGGLTLMSLIRGVILLLASCIGGITAVNKQQKRKIV